MGLSPDRKFPLAEFAPHQNLSFAWNPIGSGIMWNRHNFPVFLLPNESVQLLQEMAWKNEKNLNGHPSYVAEFDMVMQTTKIETRNSASCLKEQSCLPLGGYSVWSALPPISAPSFDPPKSILLVIASMDSASFFRDLSLGADSPMSGLIALLAAVDALSHVNDLSELRKQLVFAAFTGEAWGYLGSRRFLFELDMGTDSVKNLKSEMIEQVLEIGSVGKGIHQGATTFFAHSDKDTSSTKEILDALQKASVSLGLDDVKVKKADTSNPGVPPSSLMPFLRKNYSIAAVALEDFDTSFTNKFYHSHLDNALNINSSSIAAAAILVARALYILGSDDQTLNLMHPLNADDTSRIVWNFLADRTSSPLRIPSSCKSGCGNSSDICVGAETENSRCVTSTTRYVPAYSTRLKFEANSWHILPVNASDPLGSLDPVWTESYWKSIGLRVYSVQSSTYDNLVLLSGIGITVATYITTVAARTLLLKALKHD
ncbi:hypothetical protein HPP92_026765 [Vanilla planifolia]|uniref:Nicastrin n=1 Tax=Vanilla planifolia TaxID=51239 RepID=A0A835U774_VANPL|nr:hypothetical protein HPP92_026765 [Vanilla planifolia]